MNDLTLLQFKKLLKKPVTDKKQAPTKLSEAVQELRDKLSTNAYLVVLDAVVCGCRGNSLLIDKDDELVREKYQHKKAMETVGAFLSEQGYAFDQDTATIRKTSKNERKAHKLKKKALKKMHNIAEMVEKKTAKLDSSK